MGCFLGCFKGYKDQKRSRKPKKLFPAAKLSLENENIVFSSSSSPKEIILEAEVATGNPIPKQRENQEQGAGTNVRKKVTFDLNVTTFGGATVHGDSNDFREDNEIERNVKEDKNDKEEANDLTDALKSVVYPQNHRYQNYVSSDDEGLHEEWENSDEDEEIDFDEGNDSCCGEEESYDSYFSLPIESQVMHFQEGSSSKPTCEAATERELVVASKGNVRDRSKYIHSVLNPVENLSHWKEVKVQSASLKNPNKENKYFDSELQTFITPEPTMKSTKPLSTNINPDDFAKQEIVVDASLSNWLISSNNSIIEPQKSISFLSNSPVSKEDCHILGVLNMEDIRQSSKASSPSRSPSRNPEEIPIVGTVGGYWISKSMADSPSSWGSSASEIRGIPNTTTKYREDKKVSWYCTPFETRLERALELESARTCCNVESTS